MAMRPYWACGPGEPFGEPLKVDPYEAITLSQCDLLCLRDQLTSDPSLSRACFWPPPSATGRWKLYWP